LVDNHTAYAQRKASTLSSKFLSSFLAKIFDSVIEQSISRISSNEENIRFVQITFTNEVCLALGVDKSALATPSFSDPSAKLLEIISISSKGYIYLVFLFPYCHLLILVSSVLV
jgi:hypothetical protein